MVTRITKKKKNRKNFFVEWSNLSVAQHFKHMLSPRITGWMEMTKYGQEKLPVPYLDSYNLCSEGKEATSASFSHTTCHTRPVTLKGVSLWKDKRPHALRTGSSGLVLWPAPRNWVLGYLCRCVIFHLLLETAWSLCWCGHGLISISTATLLLGVIPVRGPIRHTGSYVGLNCWAAEGTPQQCWILEDLFDW